MKTKARIAGHPIHPMLIAFPIALYVATVVALFVFTGTRDVFWYTVAFYANVAAIVMAALAAIPGLIDLIGLPRRTQARATGIRHAAFNVLSLVLFAISAGLLYNYGSVLDVTGPLVLGILGILSTLTAGWLGWTLVQTHHVGIQETLSSDTDVRSPREDVAMPASYREDLRRPLH
jgi:uncharacterized membrane protein